jgi:acetyl esterase/lipase
MRAVRPLIGLIAAACLLPASVNSERVMSDRMTGAVQAERAGRSKGTPLTADDTIQTLLNHPALAGFGRLLLPWDDRTHDGGMRLRDVGSLLPYHTHVDPATVVGALNHMIDAAGHGQTTFYDFYTENEKKADRTKANTGLFFFRGKPGAPFAIISPGGGFAYVGSLHEGFPYAVPISKQGYNAFVLKYRAGSGAAVATRDLAAAISYVFRQATSLGVAARGYSLWGSSAGARMAAAIGSHGVASFGGDHVPRPSTVVMAYTGHSDYSDHEPPTFAVVGEHDGIAAPSVMERRVAALRKSGARVEFERYAGLGHGFGPGTGTAAEGWLDRAIEFWERSLKTAPNAAFRNRSSV